MKNVKAIIFDAYGTLFDVNSAAEKCKDKIGDKWEGFANYWRTTQLEYTWLRSLMKRHKDFWQITEDSLDKSMSVFKIDNSMRDELLNLYKILSPFEEVPEVLKSLKEKNFKLVILSNGTPSLLNELVQSNKEFTKLGFSASEAQKSVSDLANSDLNIKSNEFTAIMTDTVKAAGFVNSKIKAITDTDLKSAATKDILSTSQVLKDQIKTAAEATVENNANKGVNLSLIHI